MKKRILICDDDADTREVVSLILTKHGYDVAHAENGRLLIERARAFKPDLVFLDIMMPDMAGKDARKLLKDNPETQNIPVLIFSALNNAEQIAREIGAEGYVAKPFDIKALLDKVRNILEGLW